MIPIKDLIVENKYFVILGIFLFFLVAKEAIVLPLTHDEGNTIHCSTTTLWDIFSYKDPVPNNHILNTLFIKFNQTIFGDSLLSARLHNILSFIPFFIFVVAIAKRLFLSYWIKTFFIFSLVLQPYILDFFSVTRGYGLSLSFMMVSLYYLISRLEYGDKRSLILSLCWAGVGVYASFTLLNYFIPLSLLLLYDVFKRYWGQQKNIFYKEVVYIFLSGVVLLMVIAVPVFKMVSTKQFVYWGTKGFFEDTAKQLIISLRSGVDYFGSSNEFIYTAITIFVLSIIVICNFLNWKENKNKYILQFTILLVTAIMYNQFQFLVFNVPYLNARTALFFCPLVCIPLGLSLENLLQKYKNVTLLLVIILISLQIQHFVRGFSVKSNFEWYYDQDTYHVLDHIKEMVESGQVSKPVKINCYWIFYPSLSYHVAQKYSEYIEIAPWDTKIKDDSNSVFYYTESSEKETLTERFEVIQEYGYGARILMRAKGK